MPFDVHGALLVAVVAGVTALIRFLPFVVFGGGRSTPRFIVYLAGVLPCAIMAMLVVTMAACVYSVMSRRSFGSNTSSGIENPRSSLAWSNTFLPVSVCS